MELPGKDSVTNMNDSIPIAQGDSDILLLPGMANRHGLIAGATGTGKTVSLQVLAERFSRIGVPVFMADIKGDLSGMAQPGLPSPKLMARLERIGVEAPQFAGCPVAFWDVFGAQGHPVRTTISEMGPLLLGRLLDLNEVQAGVLSIVFKIADDNGWLLLDLKDLRAMLQFTGENAGQFTVQYGMISAASIGAIQRALLTIEEQGGEKLFGEPALDLRDFIRTDASGRGMVNILSATSLMQAPKLYSTFLLWLLSELFEQMPEVGDLEKPRIVFFFDEAHLLFDDAPEALLSKIEQVVRLIRSKGVGVYFVTQNPMDIPDVVLGQLGNRIQHALRAFTPRDQKTVNAAAETFRSNPSLDVKSVITELGVGEALISVLDERGAPTPVQRAMMLPPASRIGPAEPGIREQLIRQSLFFGKYETLVDRQSAYEMLKARADQMAAEANRKPWMDVRVEEPPTPVRQPRQAQQPAPAPKEKPPARRRESIFESMARSAARSVGTQIGRQILRGILGSILPGSRR